MAIRLSKAQHFTHSNALRTLELLGCGARMLRSSIALLMALSDHGSRPWCAWSCLFCVLRTLHARGRGPRLDIHLALEDRTYARFLFMRAAQMSAPARGCTFDAQLETVATPPNHICLIMTGIPAQRTRNRTS